MTTRPGPDLDELLNRLSGCPPVMLADPRVAGRGEVYADAVVFDTLLMLGIEAPDPAALGWLRPQDRAARNHLRLVLLACWLLHHPWFLDNGPGGAEAIVQTLRSDLQLLATVVAADRFVEDPDRREELARVLLHGLGLRPAGESVEQAQDRLQTLDSVARERLVQDTRQAEERAHRMREELRAQRAREAAASYNRE